MNEVATYIRYQINGKWTNLRLIAEEGEIQEHFEFIEGLLKEKQRADELENHVKNLEMDCYLSRERADIYKNKVSELEKRWSELVDVLKKKYEYYKVRADDESAGPIEQGKWKIAKHELMMVLMTMAELQEDDNA